MTFLDPIFNVKILFDRKNGYKLALLIEKISYNPDNDFFRSLFNVKKFK